MKKQTTLYDGPESDLIATMKPCEHKLKGYIKRKNGVIPVCYPCLICMRNIAWQDRSCYKYGICPIYTTDIEREKFRMSGPVGRARDIRKEASMKRSREVAEESQRRRDELKKMKGQRAHDI